DQSAALLAIAGERFPEATWLRVRIEDYPFDGRHDAVICWDSLFHIRRLHHRRLLTAIHRCLVPGGRLMLTVGGSENPAFTDTMFGREFFYDSHPPRRVLDMLAGIGFDLLVGEFTDEPTGGRDRGRYAIVARKGDAAAVRP
ncbi:MAG: class I SAM-dependent methyltransferase, partial [Gemmatimonadaceae bacterium]